MSDQAEGHALRPLRPRGGLKVREGSTTSGTPRTSGVGVRRHLRRWPLPGDLFGQPQARPSASARTCPPEARDRPAGGRGTTKSVDIINRHEHCSDCKGSGARKGTVATTCNYCGGQGQVVQSRGFFQVATTCPACGGEGIRVTDPCSSCRGTGRVPAVVNFKVDVPPGVESGMTIQHRGQGSRASSAPPR